MEGVMVSRLGLPMDIAAVAVSSTLAAGGAGCSDVLCDKRGSTMVPRAVVSKWDCHGGAAAGDRFSSAAFSLTSSSMPSTSVPKGISTWHPVKNCGLCCFGWSASDWERHAERCVCKGPHGLRALVSSSRGQRTSSTGLPINGRKRGTPCSAAHSPAAEAADIDGAGTAVAVFSASDRNRSGGVSVAAIAPKTRTRQSAKAINLEGWLEESLAEIVKNLRDAPFLQFVFDSSSSCDTPVQEVRSVRHQVPTEFFQDPDKWASADDTVAKLSGCADGMILVHKLRQETLTNVYGPLRSTEETGSEVAPDDEVQGDSSDLDQPHSSGMPIQEGRKWRPCSSQSSGGELLCARMPRREGMQAEGYQGAGVGSSSTDIWGLVVQGRESKHHACYILRTTRVVGECGTCTRFSVVRAKCFGPSLHTQLENSWLM
ncbi:hypothetical protein CBR_g24287 [Chara braunii]|uniref:DUF7804 domain-containing protein n=1 Tax=Chara braunii TaxID=69332 RepID=A0A388JMG0_CHABU|nr:hypothetical protein CBR_g24287 [Chara braunii]|eukprot:GBG58935.1 hypothetical protein CBR_g24287 [Chara braunii]